jgi:hypothetical protein
MTSHDPAVTKQWAATVKQLLAMAKQWIVLPGQPRVGISEQAIV